MRLDSRELDLCARFIDEDFHTNVIPNLMPIEMQCLTATCKSCRSSVVAFAIASGGAQSWMQGSYSAELEAVAVEMCQLASKSSWFSPTGDTLALLIATSPGEDLLDHALDMFDTMPNWVSRPNRDLRTNPSILETSRFHSLSGVSGQEFDHLVEKRINRALSSNWGSAYVDIDAGYDYAVMDRLQDLMKHLKALWALAKCCKGSKNALRMEEKLVGFQKHSLRANEIWVVYLLATCSGDHIESSHKLGLALMSYRETRLEG